MTATATKPKLSRMDVLGYVNPNTTGNRKNVQFKLLVRKPKKHNRMLSTFIQPIDNIIMPRRTEDGTGFEVDANGDYIMEEVEIAFIPGQSSIFVDEIMDRTKWTREVLEKKLHVIEVTDETIVCAATDINKIAYLRACNYNKDNKYRNPRKPIRFTEFNKEIESLQRAEKYKKHNEIRFTVKNLVDNNEHSKMRAMVAALTNKSIRDIQRLYSIPDLEIYLYDTAEKRPQDIEKVINDPRVIKKMTIIEAIAEGVIIQTDREFRVGSEVIHVIQRGENPVEAMVNRLSGAQVKLIETKLLPIKQKIREQEKSKDQIIEEQKRQIEQLTNGGQKQAAEESGEPRNPTENKVYAPPLIENPKAYFESLAEDGVIDMVNKSLKQCKHPEFPKMNPLKPDVKRERKAYTIDELVEIYKDHPEYLSSFFESISGENS